MFPYKSNRMIYLARFLIKRNSQLLSHGFPPFTKDCFVKMFLLTNMNNSMAGLSFKVKKTEHRKHKWVGNFSGERKERWKDRQNDEEASCEWCHAGNEALGLPCLANCSFHDDVCLPNTSFKGSISNLTFVKPLLLTCWQELTCQLLKWLAVAIHVPRWKCAKCELPPFTKDLVKGADFNLTASPGGKKSTFWKLKWWVFHHNSASKK